MSLISKSQSRDNIVVSKTFVSDIRQEKLMEKSIHSWQFVSAVNPMFFLQGQDKQKD